MNKERKIIISGPKHEGSKSIKIKKTKFFGKRVPPPPPGKKQLGTIVPQVPRKK